MNLNKLTIKSQEALQSAQEIASNYGNQVIEPEHLVAALVQDPGGTVVPVVQKIGADVSLIKLKLNELLDKLPKVSGAGLGNQSISQNLGKVFESAQKHAGNLKDEYISTEHLLLALVDGPASGAGELLQRQGIAVDAILKVLKEIRGTQRVTDQNPEDKYQALERYG
ncbi:MAG: type VI secretion system ATPase TssH, partial [Bacteroidetes bacterium]|nr:type VI secretion system ATPase TssH [Bacteroidota bacterium]